MTSQPFPSDPLLLVRGLLVNLSRPASRPTAGVLMTDGVAGSADVLLLDGRRIRVTRDQLSAGLDWTLMLSDGRPTVLSPEDLAAFERVAGQLERIRRSANEALEKSRDDERVAEAMAFFLGYSMLERFDDPAAVPCVLASRNLRTLLSVVFPGFEFHLAIQGIARRVIDVVWVDGPSEVDVARISGAFAVEASASGCGPSSVFQELFGFACDVRFDRILNPDNARRVAHQSGIALARQDAAEALRLREEAARRSFLAPRRVFPALERVVDGGIIRLVCRGLPYPAEVRRLARAGFRPSPDNVCEWTTPMDPNAWMASENLIGDPSFFVLPRS